MDFGVESYDDLGICMDGINFDFIPTSWPVIFQAFMITCVFNSLWIFALRPVSMLLADCCILSNVMLGVSRRIFTSFCDDIQGLSLPWQPHCKCKAVGCPHAAYVAEL